MIRVAAYQANPKATFAERKEQIHAVLQKADQEKIDFVCFPEGFLTGYYAQEYLARKSSLEVNDKTFKDFLIEVRHYRTTIIIGFNEKEDSKIFDSAAVIENGILLGIQRKHYLYHDYFTPSNQFQVFYSKGIIFGIVICLDTNYFEPARILALQGATILFTPMCNKVSLDHPYAKRPPYYSQFIARSHENRCWLVGADWILPNDGIECCPGHSAIYDPDGKEIARSIENQQHLIIVDIPENQLFIEKGRRIYGSQILQEQIETFFK